MATQKIDKRFGTIAIEKGIITEEQLFEVLKIQISEELENKERRLIGQILFEKGYITPDEIDDVLIAMGIL
jgi:hypothetical protein